jgi:hypothetical protein
MISCGIDPAVAAVLRWMAADLYLRDRLTRQCATDQPAVWRVWASADRSRSGSCVSACDASQLGARALYYKPLPAPVLQDNRDLFEPLRCCYPVAA